MLKAVSSQLLSMYWCGHQYWRGLTFFKELVSIFFRSVYGSQPIDENLKFNTTFFVTFMLNTLK